MENLATKNAPQTQPPQPQIQPQTHKEEESPALHFFIYLLSFASLSFAVSGVISILYAFIEKLIPDASTSSYSYYSSMDDFVVKYGISSIFIAGTLYLFLMWYINKLLFKGSIPENSKVRKWLTYIVLFVAASTVLGDLVALIYNFLGGDMALKFFLKFAVIMLTAGSIFGFYFWDMRKRDMIGRIYKKNGIFGIALGILFLLLITIPFFSISNPFEARRQKLDDAKVSSLSKIKNAVDSYYESNKELPDSLLALEQHSQTSGSSYYSLNDKDIEGITYMAKGSISYQICAEFLTVSQKDTYYYDRDWQHSAGKQCFGRSVTLDSNNY